MVLVPAGTPPPKTCACKKSGERSVSGGQSVEIRPALPLRCGPGSASLRLFLALGLMALVAEALHVAVVIGATFLKGNDVIALCSQPDPSLTLAFSTERSAGKQGGSHCLQLSSCDALGCCDLLCPHFTRMLRASTTSIPHQYTAAWLTAWFRCCLHVESPRALQSLLVKTVGWSIDGGEELVAPAGVALFNPGW